MGSQVFEVPGIVASHTLVVFQDLRPEETYLQLFDSLEKLNKIVDHTFNKIRDAVNTERAKIDAVQARLTASQAQYPVEGPIQDYSPLYSKIGKERLRHGHFHLSEFKHPQDVEASQKQFLLSSEAFLLQELQKRRQNQNLDGLGRLPDRLPSVSSLLLFNSSENPYKTYLSLDNLEGKPPAEKAAEKQALAAAPKTVAEGDELPEASRLQFGYKPQLGEVPEFNLPNNLDLPNVADIVFADSAPQQIAPSAAASALPEFDADGNIVQASMPAYQAPSQPKATPQPVAAAAPAAPSTPAPVAPSAAPASVPAPSSRPPPVDQSSSDDEDGGGGGRGDLLAAIRKGKKLKKVDAVEADEPVKAPPPKAAGGDLFSDLLSVLTRRRQGIGNRADKSEGPSSKLNIPTLPGDDGDAESADDGAWD